MKKLIVALIKKKLFRNSGGGLKFPHNIKRSNTVRSQPAIVQHEGQGYKKMHHGLKNLSIKPLKFKF